MGVKALTCGLARHGFTLVELLVVIGIVAALVAILMPALARARQNAQAIKCASNVRQIMVLMHLYAGANHGYLPYQAKVTFEDWSGDLLGTNPRATEQAVFTCPLDDWPRRFPGPARSYAVNSGKFTYLLNDYHGPWPPDRFAQPERLQRVPTQVILVSENFGPQIVPTGAIVGIAEAEALDAVTWAVHFNAGANFGFSDGHAEYRTKLAVEQYRADTDYGGDTRDPWKWKR